MHLKFCAYFVALIAHVTPIKYINVALFEEVERDVAQWPAIIDLAQKRIAKDQLLPADYQLRFVQFMP